MVIRRYIIAPRRSGPKPPENWQDEIRKIPGITIVGAGPKQVQFEAGGDAVEQLRREFGDSCHIEESVTRGRLE